MNGIKEIGFHELNIQVIFASLVAEPFIIRVVLEREISSEMSCLHTPLTQPRFFRRALHYFLAEGESQAANQFDAAAVISQKRGDVKKPERNKMRNYS